VGSAGGKSEVSRAVTRPIPCKSKKECAEKKIRIAGRRPTNLPLEGKRPSKEREAQVLEQEKGEGGGRCGNLSARLKTGRVTDDSV